MDVERWCGVKRGKDFFILSFSTRSHYVRMYFSYGFLKIFSLKF